MQDRPVGAMFKLSVRIVRILIHPPVILEVKTQQSKYFKIPNISLPEYKPPPNISPLITNTNFPPNISPPEYKPPLK